jgi:chemotaxis protein MotB
LRYQRSRSGNEGWLTSYADLITNLLIFFVLIISASQVQTGKMEKIIESISESRPVESLSQAEAALQKALEEQQLTENVRVDRSDQGLELVFDSGVTFASGAAEILQQMDGPLSKVLEVLKPYGARYQVAIEGHTDERPISNSIYKSNWELASARAMRIRERLEASGFDPKRIRVEAYADNKPLPAELGANLEREAFLAKHRRVVIRLH